MAHPKSKNNTDELLKALQEDNYDQVNVKEVNSYFQFLRHLNLKPGSFPVGVPFLYNIYCSINKPRNRISQDDFRISLSSSFQINDLGQVLVSKETDELLAQWLGSKYNEAVKTNLEQRDVIADFISEISLSKGKNIINLEIVYLAFQEWLTRNKLPGSFKRTRIKWAVLKQLKVTRNTKTIGISDCSLQKIKDYINVVPKEKK